MIKLQKFILLKKVLVLGLVTIHVIAYPSNKAIANELPEWRFGASSTAQTVHINQSVINNGDSLNRQHTIYINQNMYNEGDFIGTLTVERLNQTIRIYEGETMRNMDFGAGRFRFSGLHSGNIGLIGHNRGRTNGFFSFVRHLQYGDILTIKTAQGERRYIVEVMYIIDETDFTPLMDFGDNRLTLITCVEYRPNQRRVVMAMRI